MNTKTITWTRTLDHGGFLEYGGLHLRHFSSLGAVITEEVIWGGLSGFNDEDTLGGQGGKD